MTKVKNGCSGPENGPPKAGKLFDHKRSCSRQAAGVSDINPN
jgi:hypothetical protein